MEETSVTRARKSGDREGEVAEEEEEGGDGSSDGDGGGGRRQQRQMGPTGPREKARRGDGPRRDVGEGKGRRTSVAI